MWSSWTMTEVHYKVWVSKTGRIGAYLLPKLKAIPQTLAAFNENIKRAHFQACIWKAALDEEPPNLEPLKCRWVKEMILPSPSVQLPRSSCTSRITRNDPVYVQQWSAFVVSQMWMCIWAACSLFCKCGGSDSCCNQMTRNNMVNDANDDEEHSDDEDDGDEDDD